MNVYKLCPWRYMEGINFFGGQYLSPSKNVKFGHPKAHLSSPKITSPLDSALNVCLCVWNLSAARGGGGDGDSRSDVDGADGLMMCRLPS